MRPERCGARRLGRCLARPDGGRWVVRHAAGTTRYQHAVDGHRSRNSPVCVAPDDPVKIAVLTITNDIDRDASN